MLQRLFILLLGVYFGLLIGHGWYIFKQEPYASAVSITDFSYLNELEFKEIKALFDKAVNFHGRHEQYFYHRGQLFFVRDGHKIDAVKTMQMKKGKSWKPNLK